MIIKHVCLSVWGERGLAAWQGLILHVLAVMSLVCGCMYVSHSPWRQLPLATTNQEESSQWDPVTVTPMAPLVKTIIHFKNTYFP